MQRPSLRKERILIIAQNPSGEAPTVGAPAAARAPSPGARPPDSATPLAPSPGAGPHHPSLPTLPPLAPLPEAETDHSNPPPLPPGALVLAWWRTNRRNPLNGLQIYNGGWNPTSGGYWASVIWSGIPAVLAGLVWLLALLAIGVGLLSTCLCCKKRWQRMKANSYKPNRTLTAVIITLSICSMALCISGFVMLVVGQTALFSQVRKDTSRITEITTQVTDVGIRVGQLLEKASSLSLGLGLTLPAQVSQEMYMVGAQILAVSASVQQQTVNAEGTIDHYVYIFAIIVLVMTSVFVVLIICAIVFAIWRWKALSFVAVTLVWLLCFFSLCMLTVTLDVYNFVGDTQAALQQVKQDPTAASAFDFVVPCTNQSLISNAQTQLRRGSHSLVTLVNSAWEGSSIPPISVNGRNISQVCNPFQGPPQYLPIAQPCPPSLPNITQILDDTTVAVCASTPQLCNPTQGATAALATAALVLADALEKVYPELGPLVNCKYIAVIAEFLLSRMYPYNVAAYQAWVGYLCLSLGAMLLSLLLPYYVYRAIRTQSVVQLSSLELTGDDAEKLAGTSSKELAYSEKEGTPSALGMQAEGEPDAVSDGSQVYLLGSGDAGHGALQNGAAPSESLGSASSSRHAPSAAAESQHASPDAAPEEDLSRA